MITITKRPIDTKGPFLFDTIYSDGMEDGEQREEDFAKHMEEKDYGVFEYKVTRE